MRVDSISSTNFGSDFPKPRYITKNMRSSIESLLTKMNSTMDTKIEGDYIKATIIKKINYKDKASFEDERRLTKILRNNDQMHGYSILQIGEKNVLDIDNSNGEIIGYAKPFFKPWFLLLRQAEKVLNKMNINYRNADSVTKETLTLTRLTPEAIKELRKFVHQTEKNRLENVVKELEEIQ